MNGIELFLTRFFPADQESSGRASQAVEQISGAGQRTSTATASRARALLRLPRDHVPHSGGHEPRQHRPDGLRPGVPASIRTLARQVRGPFQAARPASGTDGGPVQKIVPGAEDSLKWNKF